MRKPFFCVYIFCTRFVLCLMGSMINATVFPHSPFLSVPRPYWRDSGRKTAMPFLSVIQVGQDISELHILLYVSRPSMDGYVQSHRVNSQEDLCKGSVFSRIFYLMHLPYDIIKQHFTSYTSYVLWIWPKYLVDQTTIILWMRIVCESYQRCFHPKLRHLPCLFLNCRKVSRAYLKFLTTWSDFVLPRYHVSKDSYPNVGQLSS